ncbi:MATE efflux family protein [Striga asiatica]|uniref:Protein DETOXIFICATION n=1 Tax=Striga asiatica TaxID=4170 RepID=A0A5A7Q5M4_STRAF|nr:MATE efflux family protein [Striga asiatica]
MLTPLIPKAQTTKKPPLSTHLIEARSISAISLPMILTGLVLYSRSVISMLFLGRLGRLPLAAGSLALGFANITGYSVLSGLAIGMEPICGQALGAHRFKLLGHTLQKTILLLLLTSIPISILWLNMNTILVFLGQDRLIADEAQSYIILSIPDLIANSFLHPLRIYLRTQSVTVPLTFCAILSIVLHVPINYFLVTSLNLGIKGVALAGVWTNANLLASLVMYVLVSKMYVKTWGGVISAEECFENWKPLVRLAVPSCVSVCLEWWWYEIMILLCGLLPDPSSKVGSMGILIQTTSFVYVFPSSLSFGVSTRVGNELGAGRPGRARKAAVVGLVAGFLLGFLALVFAFGVRNVWARVFTADGEIVAVTSAVLPVVGLCEIGNCPQTAGCGVLRGTARPEIGANVNLGCFYGVGMPVAVWGYGFEGLWVGMAAAQGCCAAAMVFVVVRTDWEGEAVRAKELTDGEIEGDGDEIGGITEGKYKLVDDSPA